MPVMLAAARYSTKGPAVIRELPIICKRRKRQLKKLQPSEAFRRNPLTIN
jgi:hypothetical protein